MHYFIYGPAIAAVEDKAQAAKYKAAGWQRVTRTAFMQAWRERDLAQLAELPPMKMATLKSGDVIERLPNGYARFHV